MLITGFALALTLQAVGPTQVANVEASAPLIRAQLEEELLDYPTARFRDVYVTINPVAEAESGRSGPGYLCGYVNSKNRMGGYVGWTRFMAIGSIVVLEGESGSSIILNGACGPRSANDGVDRSEWLVHR